METLKETTSILTKSYNKTASKRVKLTDLFIAFNLLLALIQYAYVKVAGNYPYNAFLSGLFCNLGTATLTGCLRMQVAAKTKTEERAYAEYLFCILILYLLVFNYLG